MEGVMGKQIELLQKKLAEAEGQLSRQENRVELLKKTNQTLEEEVVSKRQELDTLRTELEKNDGRLAELERTDGITGLYNEKAMQEIVTRKVDEARRYQLPLSLVKFSLHTGSLQESLEQQPDDSVLKGVADVIRKGIRSVDYAGFAGKNFTLLLSNTNEVGAKVTAERIRANVVGLQWPQKEVAVSLKGGVVSLKNDDAEAFVMRADKVLEDIKSGGKKKRGG